MKALCLASLVAVISVEMDAAAQEAWKAFEDGRFSWKASGPLLDVGPGKSATDPHVAMKDPTVVFHDGSWHLFATVRMKSGRVDIEYLRFSDWAQANQAPRHVLALHDQYYCAPQVFYFRPHKKWYLVYQPELRWYPLATGHSRHVGAVRSGRGTGKPRSPRLYSRRRGPPSAPPFY